MSGKSTKALRGAIQAAVKEIFPTIFSAEIKEEMLKALSPMVTTILDNIRTEMLAAVNRAKEQTEAKENHLLKVSGEYLEKANVSLAAWQLLMAEKLSIPGLLGPEFTAELEAKKALVREELQAVAATPDQVA